VVTDLFRGSPDPADYRRLYHPRLISLCNSTVFGIAYHHIDVNCANNIIDRGINESDSVNGSLLAHGIKPVSKDEYLKLENMSKVFIRSIIPSFDEDVFKISKIL
jgi:hypothetical protein